jgi:hypothetical protein
LALVGQDPGPGGVQIDADAIRPFSFDDRAGDIGRIQSYGAYAHKDELTAGLVPQPDFGESTFYQKNFLGWGLF